MAASGDDGTAPRHALFYFYGGDVKALAEAASRQNYFTRPTRERDGLVLEKTIAVDEESFAPVAAQMEAWANAFNSEYDGWEAAVLEA